MKLEICFQCAHYVDENTLEGSMLVKLRVILGGGQLRLQVIHKYTQFGSGGRVCCIEDVDLISFDKSFDMQ